MTFFQQLGSALESRFKTLIELDAQNDLVARVAYGSFSPDPAWLDKRWARVTFQLADASMAAADGTSGIHEHTGLVFVELYEAPGAGHGAGPLTEVADRVAGAFRAFGQQNPQIETGSPRVSAPEIEQGSVLRLLVTIPFTAYQTFAHAT